jgi:uncharacterized protein YbjT (DUF2867 family)
MAASQTVLVTGATGKTGRHVVEGAARRGWNVRLAVRTPSPGSRSIRFDWMNDSSWSAALSGVNSIYVVAPFNTPGAPERIPDFIEAADQAGVDRIVLLSSWDISRSPSDSPLRAAESALEWSAADTCALRPTWFLDNFTTGSMAYMVDNGIIRLPAGDGTIPYVDVRDVAAVAVSVLDVTDEAPSPLEITGPEQINHYQIATSLSSALNRRIRYEPVTVEEFRRRLRTPGFRSRLCTIPRQRVQRHRHR